MSTHLSAIELRVLLISVTRCLRTATLLVALQAPMWWAVGRATSAVEAATPARLSLLLDTGLALTLMVLAIRCCELVRASRSGPRTLRTTRIASSGLVLAGALDLVENVVLWDRFGAGGPPAPSLQVSGLSEAWWALALVTGLVLTRLVHRATMASDPGDPRTTVSVTDEATTTADVDGTVIACSGGGIRSASFCLGALQSLMAHGVYHRASTVVGVSGGGYMAAAFHLVGRGLDATADPPFAQGTPELGLLRRNTRYLLPRGVVVVRGLMSVLFGVLVNLTIILVTLHAVAWLLGWYLHEYGVLRTDGSGIAVDPPTWWVAVALAPWALTAAEFVLLDKVVDRFHPVPDAVRAVGHRLTRVLLPAGVAMVVLMLAVPFGLLALTRQVGSERPLLDALGAFVQPWQHGWPSVGSALAVIVALIGLGRTVVTGLGAVGDEGGRLQPLVAKLRVVVAPWLGTAVILVGGALMLLGWTHTYATDAGWRSDWSRALWLLGVVAVIRLATDANRTSLHHFYRERLCTAFLVERTSARTARARPYRDPIRISDFARRNGTGGPQLVMAAVANVVDQDLVPTGRGCVPFIIAADRTGVVGDRTLPPHGTTGTRLYEAFADYGARDLTVPAAMAISGAAFSPLTGRASARTRPVRLLLTVLNARLGVWLPNPYAQPPVIISRALLERARYDALAADRRSASARLRVWSWEVVAHLVSVAAKPGPYRLLREAFGRPTLYDRKLYVTDGGHYDNLGLVEALRRRPRRVIVIDASNDEEDSFGALSDAIATARMDLGVEVRVDVEGMTSTVTQTGRDRALSAWTVGTATHGDGRVTEVFYLKALLTDGLPTDLEHYARDNPDFPRRSTGRQLYDEWDFEAYRQLGNTLADGLVLGSALAPRVGPVADAVGAGA